MTARTPIRGSLKLRVWRTMAISMSVSSSSLSQHAFLAHSGAVLRTSAMATSATSSSVLDSATTYSLQHVDYSTFSYIEWFQVNKYNHIEPFPVILFIDSTHVDAHLRFTLKKISFTQCSPGGVNADPHCRQR